MTPEPLVAAALGGCLIAYVVTGGADFGGGVWDLVATGPRRVEQRRAIATTIGPIWEANHVWLIAALVLTFVCFPRAYAAISTHLHLPLLLLLVGVVVRGSAFVFRAYASRDDDVQRALSVPFAVASTVTPVMLGVVVGTIASGRIRVDADPTWFGDWLAPFPWAVGGLTLAIFAFLAAVYLTLGTHGALQEDFRRRGLFASAAVFVLAWVCFGLARTGAPEIWHGLWASAWAWPFQLAVATVGLSCIAALYRRRYPWARTLAIAEAVLVVSGWALAQYPYVVVPDLTVADAAPANVLWAVLLVLGIGAGPLLATYAWLLRLFRV